MDEGQQGARLDDPGSSQGVHQQIDPLRRHPGEPSRATGIHTVTQHRSRACQRGGTRGKPAETGENGPTHVPGSGRFHPIQMAGQGWDRGIAQVGQQLGEQERVPARYRLAGIDEPILCGPEHRGDHRVHRSASQGLWADLHGLRLGGQQPVAAPAARPTRAVRSPEAQASARPDAARDRPGSATTEDRSSVRRRPRAVSAPHCTGPQQTNKARAGWRTSRGSHPRPARPPAPGLAELEPPPRRTTQRIHRRRRRASVRRTSHEPAQKRARIPTRCPARPAPAGHWPAPAHSRRGGCRSCRFRPRPPPAAVHRLPTRHDRAAHQRQTAHGRGQTVRRGGFVSRPTSPPDRACLSRHRTVPRGELYRVVRLVRSPHAESRTRGWAGCTEQTVEESSAFRRS